MPLVHRHLSPESIGVFMTITQSAANMYLGP
jgi:hypothetical protein